MRLVLGSLLLSTFSCSLVTAVPDDSTRDTSSQGGTTTSTGHGGSGAMGGSGAAAGSAVGGSGGAPCGGANLETDPDNCGACAWDCGDDTQGAPLPCSSGVCAATIVEFGAQLISGLLVEGEKVILQRGATLDRVTELEVRDVGLVGLPMVYALDDLEQGAGFLASGGPAQFYYAPQLSPVPPQLLVCGLDGSACVLKDVRSVMEPGLTAGHVNGIVRLELGDAAKLFMLFTAQAETSRKLSVVDETCVTENVTCQDVSAQSGELLSTSSSIPVHIDAQITEGSDPSLWWTTFAISNEPSCVHRASSLASPSAAEVPCAIELPSLHRLTVAGSNLFLGTPAGGAGPIHRVWNLAALSPSHVEISHTTARWPADTDISLLYAFATPGANQSEPALGALRPDQPTGGGVTKLGEVLLAANEVVTAVDASHTDYVFFATFDGNDGNLYRWRKPAAGYQ